ncbi:MAG: protein kinase [Chloracidobacterium sp.]|nr:protein kinase [Chloracidobacterium sp.]
MISDFIGKIIAGKFRIDSLVRETEVGDFYRGTNLTTGVPATIKILAPAMAIDQRYIDRFMRDEKAAAAVSHPNILNNLEIGLDEHGTPHSVYEGMDGGLLSALIREKGQLPVTDAITIAKQVASALSAAHAAGLVHSGLNPDKVFIDSD